MRDVFGVVMIVSIGKTDCKHSLGMEAEQIVNKMRSLIRGRAFERWDLPIDDFMGLKYFEQPVRHPSNHGRGNPGKPVPAVFLLHDAYDRATPFFSFRHTFFTDVNEELLVGLPDSGAEEYENRKEPPAEGEEDRIAVPDGRGQRRPRSRGRDQESRGSGAGREEVREGDQ